MDTVGTLQATTASRRPRRPLENITLYQPRRLEHYGAHTLSTTEVGTLQATTASRRPLKNVTLYQPQRLEHSRRASRRPLKNVTLYQPRRLEHSRRPQHRGDIALYQPRRLEHSRRPQHRGDRWKPRGWNTPGDHSGARRHMNARLSVMPRRFHTCICSWFLASAMTVLKGRLSVRGCPSCVPVRGTVFLLPLPPPPTGDPVTP